MSGNNPAFPILGGTLAAVPASDCAGLTKREYFAALNYAAILGKIAFDQPSEDMMIRAGIDVGRFEQFAADLAVSGADATIAALSEDTSQLDVKLRAAATECQHDWQPTGRRMEMKCAKCGATLPF